MCFIRMLPWAELPKSRARDRIWVLGVYSEGDGRKEEAGTGKSETGIGNSQNQSCCQGHSKGRWGNEGERQLLWDRVRSL